MSNDICLMGEGPVEMPEDLLSPLGLMSNIAGWVSVKWAEAKDPREYFAEMAVANMAVKDVLDRRDTMRAEIHKRKLDDAEFEQWLVTAQNRIEAHAYQEFMAQVSPAAKQYEVDREKEAMNPRVDYRP
jgi:hypothetical protein